MTWTTEFKMTTDTALGGQTEEEHLSHFPTGEALHTSMGKILNTMASPDLCPSQCVPPLTTALNRKKRHTRRPTQRGARITLAHHRSPLRCARDRPHAYARELAILAHQRDNEYVPPGDTEPPAEKGKKKQKVARPKCARRSSHPRHPRALLLQPHCCVGCSRAEASS